MTAALTNQMIPVAGHYRNRLAVRGDDKKEQHGARVLSVGLCHADFMQTKHLVDSPSVIMCKIHDQIVALIRRAVRG